MAAHGAIRTDIQAKDRDYASIHTMHSQRNHAGVDGGKGERVDGDLIIVFLNLFEPSDLRSNSTSSAMSHMASQKVSPIPSEIVWSLSDCLHLDGGSFLFPIRHYVDGCNPHQCALDHVR